MLTFNSDAMMMTSGPDPQRWAVELFKQSVGNGQLRRLWRGFLGRPTALRTLAEASRAGQRAVGRATIAIAEIVGSEGRSGDFDLAFAPLATHTKDRWVSVARARRAGCSLPPVQLIRALDGYYVRDGHHRISVARALGEEFIEADVVSWE